MDLSFRELQKRDVINLPDGKNLGRITNLLLNFPQGVLTGIYVPGKKQNCFSRLFSKTELFIERSNIVKIGNDVILVDIRNGVPNDSVSVDKKPCPKPPKHSPSCEDLFSPCSPPPPPRPYDYDE
jgi:YlmC/YmxH family sporulation protein